MVQSCQKGEFPYLHVHFVMRLFTIVKIKDQPRCPQQMNGKRQFCVYVHNGVSLNQKGERNPVIFGNIDKSEGLC
jgi:hypothetical protein